VVILLRLLTLGNTIITSVNLLNLKNLAEFATRGVWGRLNMIDVDTDELFDFIGRIGTAIITIILNLFLGLFRNYVFYYIVYIYSLFSNNLSQITAIGQTGLDMFESIEGSYLVGTSLIFAIISLIPAIWFLKRLNEEVYKQELGLNLILALLIELITLFL